MLRVVCFLALYLALAFLLGYGLVRRAARKPVYAPARVQVESKAPEPGSPPELGASKATQ